MPHEILKINQDQFATMASAVIGVRAATIVMWQLINGILHKNLQSFLMFVPVAIITADIFGPNAQFFLRELGHCLSVANGEQWSYSFLLQRLAVTVQRGNAASVSGIHVYLVMFSISVFVCCFY